MPWITYSQPCTLNCPSLHRSSNEAVHCSAHINVLHLHCFTHGTLQRSLDVFLVLFLCHCVAVALPVLLLHCSALNCGCSDNLKRQLPLFILSASHCVLCSCPKQMTDLYLERWKGENYILLFRKSVARDGSDCEGETYLERTLPGFWIFGHLNFIIVANTAGAFHKGRGGVHPEEAARDGREEKLERFVSWPVHHLSSHPRL